MRLYAKRSLLLDASGLLLTIVLPMTLFASSAGAQGEEAASAVQAVETESEPRRIDELPVVPGTPVELEPVVEKFEGVTYPVSQFLLDFLVEPPNAPEIESLRDTPIELATMPHADGEGDVWVPAERRDNAQRFELNALPEVGPFRFSPGALASINRQIVSALSREGLGSIIVAPDEADIGFTTGEDLREPGNTELRLTIFLPTIREIQSFATGERIPEDEATNHPAHARVLENSPVKGGELFWPNLVDDYVARLNRHPGRRVVAQLSPSVDPQQLYLDYQITESKPWVAYASILNTGSEATGRWQARVGLVHLQPTNRDDILSLDYVVNTNGNVQAVNAGYEFPVWTDRLRIVIEGSYVDFEAKEKIKGDGAASDFRNLIDGKQIRGGLSARLNVFQYDDYFVDLLGGATYEYLDAKFVTEIVDTDNQTRDVQAGTEDFLTARFGVGLERKTPKLKLEGRIWVDYEAFDHETSKPTEELTDFESLGRQDPDKDPFVLRWDSRAAFFVDALLADPNNPAPIHAHEVVLRYRGQSAFDKYRLIAYEQQVAGGLETVRGYEQGATAGDSAHIASLEYRFHVPRIFKPRPATIQFPLVGEFAYAPRGLGERPDWDWVLKAFYDVANVKQSDRIDLVEYNDTLHGVGVGTEFYFKRNFQIRADWGMALKSIRCDDTGNSGTDCAVDSGDWEIGIAASVFY